MKTLLLYMAILLPIIGFYSCQQTNIVAGDNPVPILNVLDISPDTVVEFQQIIDLTLQYEDGDGDIGELDPDVGVIFVQDSRLAEPDLFHVQPLAPLNGPSIHIKGTLVLQIKNSFVLGNAAQEKVIYSVWLRDRAGHESKVVTTPPIWVTR